MKRNENGFTLIEVTIAIMVITIGIVSVQMMQVKSIDEDTVAGGLPSKSMLAAAVVEGILALQYNDALLVDTDGDGTNQDGNWDGIDDDDDNNFSATRDNEEFGLRNSECCSDGNDPRGNPVAGCVAFADQCTFYDDYNIYWNIAVDFPVENTKTIKITVINSSEQATQVVIAAGQRAVAVNRAEYTYIKDDVI